MLHVVEPLTFLAGSVTAQELLEQAVAKEQENLTKCLGPVLDGKPFKRIVVKGDPAREILRIARDENIDLIVMPTHGYGAFEKFMLGSVTAKVLHQSTCPVWTGAHVKDVPTGQFAIRNVLCAVDFGPLSSKAITWAQEAATEFGAKLTLAHVTPSMEIYGPGGFHVLTDMKNELVNSAKAQIAQIQQEMGIHAGALRWKRPRGQSDGACRQRDQGGPDRGGSSLAGGAVWGYRLRNYSRVPCAGGQHMSLVKALIICSALAKTQGLRSTCCDAASFGMRLRRPATLHIPDIQVGIPSAGSTHLDRTI